TRDVFYRELCLTLPRIETKRLRDVNNIESTEFPFIFKVGREVLAHECNGGRINQRRRIYCGTGKSDGAYTDVAGKRDRNTNAGTDGIGVDEEGEIKYREVELKRDVVECLIGEPIPYAVLGVDIHEVVVAGKTHTDRIACFVFEFHATTRNVPRFSAVNDIV